MGLGGRTLKDKGSLGVLTRLFRMVRTLLVGSNDWGNQSGMCPPRCSTMSKWAAAPICGRSPAASTASSLAERCQPFIGVLSTPRGYFVRTLFACCVYCHFTATRVTQCSAVRCATSTAGALPLPLPLDSTLSRCHCCQTVLHTGPPLDRRAVPSDDRVSAVPEDRRARLHIPLPVPRPRARLHRRSGTDRLLD